MPKAKNQSEHMFVEWSLDIKPDHYDVERVAALLRGLDQDELHGLDIGGGIGRYAQLVCDKVPGCRMTVLDKSELAEDAFVDDDRLQLEAGDYFDYQPGRRYDFVVFKTVLHHFIADSENATLELQRQALRKARSLLRPGGLLLIEENFYQGLLGDDLPGRLIYAVTKQQWIADLVRRLGANTAGEGVRFRSFNSWRKLVSEEGFALNSLECSPTWGQTWPAWQRIPLLSSGRFQGVLEARALPLNAAAERSRAAAPESGVLAALTRPFAYAREALEQRLSTRWRYFLAVLAVTGPAVSTCTLAES